MNPYVLMTLGGSENVGESGDESDVRDVLQEVGTERGLTHALREQTALGGFEHVQKPTSYLPDSADRPLGLFFPCMRSPSIAIIALKSL